MIHLNFYVFVSRTENVSHLILFSYLKYQQPITRWTEINTRTLFTLVLTRNVFRKSSSRILWPFCWFLLYNGERKLLVSHSVNKRLSSPLFTFLVLLNCYLFVCNSDIVCSLLCILGLLPFSVCISLLINNNDDNSRVPTHHNVIENKQYICF